MAAKHVSRPVKLVVTRRQMFGPTGGRAHTEQRVTLGAKKDGTLTAVRHTTVATTSMLEDFLETCGAATRMLYESPNIETDHDLKRLNVGSPTFMRAPGEATGTFALESAMDELAVRCAWTRSSCVSRTTRSAIRNPASRGRASRCASAIAWAPSDSDGASDRRRRVR
jgi:CO/xanthine dehydrogenase Mo-binding subunit